jgi:hypothetical protein
MAARSAANARNKLRTRFIAAFRTLWRTGWHVKQGHPPAPLTVAASWTRLVREANIQAE